MQDQDTISYLLQLNKLNNTRFKVENETYQDNHSLTTSLNINNLMLFEEKHKKSYGVAVEHSNTTSLSFKC